MTQKDVLSYSPLKHVYNFRFNAVLLKQTSIYLTTIFDFHVQATTHHYLL